MAGVALGGGVTYVSERARWKREQASRWADERRVLYAKVIAECEHMAEEVTGELLDQERLTFGDFRDALGPTRDRLRVLVADLELIGTEDDAAAARALMASAERLLNKSVRNPDAPAVPAWDEWSDALAQFKKQARAGLHLVGG